LLLARWKSPTNLPAVNPKFARPSPH